jgi:hypothetical protein
VIPKQANLAAFLSVWYVGLCGSNYFRQSHMSGFVGVHVLLSIWYIGLRGCTCAFVNLICGCTSDILGFVGVATSVGLICRCTCTSVSLICWALWVYFRHAVWLWVYFHQSGFVEVSIVVHVNLWLLSLLVGSMGRITWAVSNPVYVIYIYGGIHMYVYVWSSSYCCTCMTSKTIQTRKK